MAKETIERIVVPAVKTVAGVVDKLKNGRNGRNGFNGGNGGNGYKKKNFQGVYSLLDSELKPKELVPDKDGVLRPQNIHEERYIIQQVQKAKSTAGFNKIELKGKVDETGNPKSFRVKDGGERGVGLIFYANKNISKQGKTRAKAIKDGSITEENSKDTFKKLMGIGKRNLDELESMALVDYVQTTQANLKAYLGRVEQNRYPNFPHPYGDQNYFTDGHIYPPKHPAHLDVAEQRHLEPAQSYVDASGRTMKGNFESVNKVGFTDEDLILLGVPRNRYEHMENYFFPNRRGVRSFLGDDDNIDRVMVQRKSGVDWQTIFAEQGIQGSPADYI